MVGFGQELREIVSKQINKETDYTKIEFGPNPIRENIFVVFVKPSSESDIKVKNLLIDKRLVIIINVNHIKENSGMYLLFKLMNHDILFFYNISLKQKYINDYNYEINSLFANSYSTLEKLFNIKWYNMLLQNKLLASARKLILKIYKRSIEFESELLEYKNERKLMINRIKYNSFLVNYIDKFEEYTEPDTGLHKLMYPSLKYMEDQLNTYRNIKGFMVGSLLTAIGAIIGVILAKYLKQ